LKRLVTFFNILRKTAKRMSCSG